MRTQKLLSSVLKDKDTRTSIPSLKLRQNLGLFVYSVCELWQKVGEDRVEKRREGTTL